MENSRIIMRFAKCITGARFCPSNQSPVSQINDIPWKDTEHRFLINKLAQEENSLLNPENMELLYAQTVKVYSGFKL